jgi:hypothetical protein
MAARASIGAFSSLNTPSAPLPMTWSASTRAELATLFVR